MPSDSPREHEGVMISSSFADLREHRRVLSAALTGQGLFPVAMENDSAKPTGDVLENSLAMVASCSAYVAVIGHRYGQIPESRRRNPKRLSLTELEFNKARRLKRPVLLFIMGDGHDVKPADVEQDPEKNLKLAVFRENAKRVKCSSSIHRVYKIFNSLREFEQAATQSIADFCRYLDSKTFASGSDATKHRKVTQPLDLRAKPIYIASRSFVGRQAELETLSEWASPADSHAILLFEAIGGAGKSMLAWEWATKHAPGIRDDWKGRFWYSFYEKSATMLDFCREALAYMGKWRSRHRRMNTFELAKELVQQLQAGPWLLVLDGLERVLVAYHRFDAAQIPDEEAGTNDKIAHRHPCAAINPEDDDLIRALAGAHPSKLLVTSRLVPRTLLNASSQPIPGVLQERLRGLRPVDAESLIRECGITGSSLEIQKYLKTYCDCHPLVVGVLAGLINDYLPDRGNFDAWSIDRRGGGLLNLANLDLVQNRNHILSAALNALPKQSRQLLSTLALLSESIDYDTLNALNPHLLPLPEEQKLPKRKTNDRWTAAQRAEIVAKYEAARQKYVLYQEAVEARQAASITASDELTRTVSDLERRGLLQYDAAARRYDLHPVVRGISAGRLRQEEKDQLGQRVVDHFSQKAHNPYTEAETLDDLSNAFLVVKALFQMGKLEQARKFILGNDFLQALSTKFEAHNEILTILRPFFSSGWSTMPAFLQTSDGILLAKRAANCLRRINQLGDAFAVSEAAVPSILNRKRCGGLYGHLLSMASTAGEQGRLALEERLMHQAAQIVPLLNENYGVETTFRLARFRQLSRNGAVSDAESIWSFIRDARLNDSERAVAEHHYALHLLFCHRLTEEDLARAEASSRAAQSALGIRNLSTMRGYWRLEEGKWSQAKMSLQESITLAHRAGKTDRRTEILLAIAKYKLNQLPDAHDLAEQFSNDAEGSCNRPIAELWLCIGDRARAMAHAITAYKWAWADGEPYVRRYELSKSVELLQRINARVPQLPEYDGKFDPGLPWESDVAHAIGRLQVERRPNSP
jgi:hypothetical protein